MTNSAPITELPKNLIRQYFDYTGEYFVEHWLIAKQYRGHELVHMIITKSSTTPLLSSIYSTLVVELEYVVIS